MLAISEGYSRRVEEKKENSINIYIYIKRKILEAIQIVVWFIASQTGRETAPHTEVHHVTILRIAL